MAPHAWERGGGSFHGGTGRASVVTTARDAPVGVDTGAPENAGTERPAVSASTAPFQGGDHRIHATSRGVPLPMTSPAAWVLEGERTETVLTTRVGRRGWDGRGPPPARRPRAGGKRNRALDRRPRLLGHAVRLIGTRRGLSSGAAGGFIVAGCCGLDTAEREPVHRVRSTKAIRQQGTRRHQGGRPRGASVPAGAVRRSEATMSSRRASSAPACRARASEQNVKSRRPSTVTRQRSGSSRSIPTTWPFTFLSV